MEPSSPEPQAGALTVRPSSLCIAQVEQNHTWDVRASAEVALPGRSRPASRVPCKDMAFPRNQKLNLLRLTVLLIVALAGIKFIFRDSVTPDLHKHISKDNDFWGKAGEEKEEANPHNQALELSAVKIMGPKEDTKKQLSKDFSTTEMRLVHLDLKGAAPKVSYLEQVFPLLSKLGANGILVEYEDMFPFKGELETLKSSYAYSEDDIEKIQRLAALSKLEVVPLVQTFGHVEFILKHDKYRYLREVERFPNSLNPHLPDTLSLLKSILSQVMDKHRHSSWIHIGADEVFHLGEGMDSKNWISLNNGDVGKMYLNHIKEVVNFIVNQYKGLQVLMWDDMLRKISVGAIQESGIPKHASPVLWFYAPDFDTEQIGKFISKYADSGFKSVWFASAFKGTTGPAQAWTPLNYHLKNHLSWLKVIQAMSKFPFIKFQGIALTGWQRYDHYSVLCELLPVGIPSLAMCLQTLVNGGQIDEGVRCFLARFTKFCIHGHRRNQTGGSVFTHRSQPLSSQHSALKALSWDHVPSAFLAASHAYPE
ncbi:hexosaminidase D isoform X3 [Chelonia mydas]|uniref:hexosaminidase D isoform X3 n=1 Tax=Chelonia mydas TaxID=8469 RepID=UPI0018A1E2B8|nr:hexosaminidase D isoform X3 [Chelonia mydas]